MSLKSVAVPFVVFTAGIFAVGPKASDLLPDPEIIRVEVEKQEPSYGELLKTIPASYGIPKEVIAVVLTKEHDDARYPYRFEPGQMGKPYVTKWSKDDSMRRLLASSYCPMQVMGYHAAEAGLHPMDLLKPETCVELASKYLAGCLERGKNLRPTEKYYQAFKCYNGGDEYAQDAMVKLTDLLYARLAKG